MRYTKNSLAIKKTKLGYLCAKHIPCIRCLQQIRLKAIYKNKGEADDIQNYHPVYLLSNASKIFEKAIYEGLVDFLDAYGVVVDCQFGFRI